MVQVEREEVVALWRQPAVVMRTLTMDTEAVILVMAVVMDANRRPNPATILEAVRSAAVG